jgi:hypothetical protein
MMLTDPLLLVAERCPVEYRSTAACHRLTAVLDQPHSPAQVRDLSTSGAVLCLRHLVEPGALLTIEIYNSTGHFWHRKTLFVRQVESQYDGSYRVGGTFTWPLSETQLHELLG